MRYGSMFPATDVPDPMDRIAVVLRETAELIRQCRASAAEARRMIHHSRSRAVGARLLIARSPRAGLSSDRVSQLT